MKISDSFGTSYERSTLELKARIEYISTSGLVEVKFNQDIIFPENFIKLVNYYSNQSELKFKRRLCSDCKESMQMTPDQLYLIE